MDYEEFEKLYEDELEAMIQIEDGNSGSAISKKAKRSLDFSTPTTKCVRPKMFLDNADDSFGIKPLDQLIDDELSISRKRKAEEKAPNLNSSNELDLHLSDDSSPELFTSSDNPPKKSKTLFLEGIDFDSDFDITPPTSPVVTSKNVCSSPILKEPKIDFPVSQHLHRRIPNGDFVSVIDNQGNRYYLSMKSEDDINKEIMLLSSKSDTKSLLTAPLAVLRTQIEEEKYNETVKESEALARRLDKKKHGDDVDDVIITDDTISSLWVDKYSPGTYTELLSDEATNRALLKWLKLWDFVVFGKDMKVLKAAEKLKEEKKKKFEQKGFAKNVFETLEELDQYKRPYFKAVLICGPPGLGKTTLGHVLAKHAGYNVVEINASDDRSAEVFKQKIENATQMKSVLGMDKKPNCLIIDEIDGAPQAAINILLSLIAPPTKDNQSTAASAKKKGSKKQQQLLMRPIICICNDLYVPALRQLRQQTFVIHFPETVTAKLASRLYEVSKQEGLKADMTTLISLAEKADNDIRSCLNTLQFVQRQCNSLTPRLVQDVAIGMKDVQKSLFEFWKQIFALPRPSKQPYVFQENNSGPNGEHQSTSPALNNPTSLPARFHNTLQSSVAVGEYDKVIQGLFDNYLHAKTRDTRLEAVVHGTDWLLFFDVLSQEVQHSQNYIYTRYLPFTVVTFHFCFASNTRFKIHYPQSQYEFYLKQQRCQHIAHTMLQDASTSVRKNLSQQVLCTEVLPALTDIIQPTLRPVNIQLYSTREKEDLSNLIKIMISYNLSYRQERSAEGQYVYMLEPNIEELVHFTDLKARRQLTYAAKQLISHEIEIEKMRREEAPTVKLDSKEKEPAKVEAVKEATVPNYKRQTLQPVRVTEELKPKRDFFGRKVVKKEATDAKPDEKQSEKIGGEIWFSFKEGFSNAVRRTVRVQDFLI